MKASSLYDFYWWIADRSVIDQRRSELEFYRHLLSGYRPGDLIFDIGANQGFKSDIFLRLGANVVAVDPDEANKEVLTQRFLKYRFIKKPIRIVGKAVSDSQGVERIWIDAPGSAKNSLSRKWVETLRSDTARFGKTLNFREGRQVETTTLEQLIDVYGAPFFIKIDVEGYEVNVLRGLRRAVPFISFELNLPEFRAEGLECLYLLERVAAGGTFNFTSDCRRGLALQQWLEKNEFSEILRNCNEECIEIFWAAPVSGTNQARSGRAA